MSEDLPFVDVVITGLISSVAADAYTFGLLVIQILDGSVLNLSPSRLADYIIIVQTKNKMLMTHNKKMQSKNEPKKFKQK